MNCLLAGAPTGTTPGVARALLAAAPGAPLTLLSDDTEGLLRLLDEPGLSACEVLWADAANPATVDDALVHRRMLHGRPDVVVVVVDRDTAWTLGGVLVPRLSGTPLVVTGEAAAALAPRVAADLRALTDGDGEPPVHAIVPGDDPDAVVRRAAELVRTAPAPPDAPLLSGHCAH